MLPSLCLLATCRVFKLNLFLSNHHESSCNYHPKVTPQWLSAIRECLVMFWDDLSNYSRLQHLPCVLIGSGSLFLHRLKHLVIMTSGVCVPKLPNHMILLWAIFGNCQCISILDLLCVWCAQTKPLWPLPGVFCTPPPSFALNVDLPFISLPTVLFLLVCPLCMYVCVSVCVFTCQESVFNCSGDYPCLVKPCFGALSSNNNNWSSFREVLTYDLLVINARKDRAWLSLMAISEINPYLKVAFEWS